jgi:hypothetical protein
MNEANRKRWIFLAGCLLAGGLALAGCRSEEQNRITGFEKGTYLGKPDQKLSDEQLLQLRRQTQRQRG